MKQQDFVKLSTSEEHDFNPTFQLYFDEDCLVYSQTYVWHVSLSQGLVIAHTGNKLGI